MRSLEIFDAESGSQCLKLRAAVSSAGECLVSRGAPAPPRRVTAHRHVST